jgi:hypothetical protein
MAADEKASKLMSDTLFQLGKLAVNNEAKRMVSWGMMRRHATRDW